jgi:hypothetical protein
MEGKQTWLILGGALLVAVVMSVVIVAGSGGSGKGRGLQDGPPPWQPEYSGLRERIQSLGIPAPGRETYHIHARLHVYANGQPVTVPANIGIDQASGTASALHTHDTQGIIHIEADQPFTVKLSDFFEIWGVKFADDQLGSFKNAGDQTLQVFVNGTKVDKPSTYVLKAHDTVIVGYGKADSFPTTDANPFPAGL